VAAPLRHHTAETLTNHLVSTIQRQSLTISAAENMVFCFALRSRLPGDQNDGCQGSIWVLRPWGLAGYVATVLSRYRHR